MSRLESAIRYVIQDALARDPVADLDTQSDVTTAIVLRLVTWASEENWS